MLPRAFIVLSAASALALGVACGSFDAAPAPGTDGGPGESGSPDVGPTSDASPQLVRRCSGKAVRDDTFDQPFLAAGWTITANAAVSAVDAGPTPPALLAQIGELGNVEVKNTLSDRLLLDGKGKVCIELDVLYEVLSGAFTNDAYAEILLVRGIDSVLFAEMRAQGFALVEGTTAVGVPGFAVNAWQHLVMRIPFGTGGKPSLEVDGFAAAIAPSSAGEIPQTVDFHVGLAASGRSGTTAASRVHIDNFRLTTEL